MVNDIKDELNAILPKIEEKIQEVQKMMILIEDDKKIADELNEITANEEEKAQKANVEVMDIKNDIEKDLAEALSI
jgi:hypothetical protein